ncbi:hypothetical protein M0813_08011 [Anaeramoeba flamelloides]|uniref:Uncharacterized protein n=1 Tax=Anaeramoeba flamelloides TaxID=1746091 RepID=A0ABQ8XCT5_9EUKA|nr:hypothetical protein M0813_08011 [Anaeramoeba flamelloides]
MQNSSKPFPHSPNPILVDSTNWVLMKTIKTKKTLAKKYAKIIYFVLEMDSSVPKTTQQSTFLKSMAGEFKSTKAKKEPNKRMGNNRRSQSHDHICRNCIQLWGKWNANGNPIIRTLKERIKVFENGEDPESDEKQILKGNTWRKKKRETKTKLSHLILEIIFHK